MWAFPHPHGAHFSHVVKLLSITFFRLNLALFALQWLPFAAYSSFASICLHTVYDSASRRYLPFGHKVSQREVVDHVLNLLHVILDAIASPPKRVVFQIEDLESRMKILNEAANFQWPLIISKCY